MNSIEGHVAVVTGAAGGIGLAITESLIDAGARVVLTDVDLAAIEDQAARLVPSAIAVRLDVTDRAAWAEARAVAERRLGPVDILVNNAGIAPDWAELVDTPDDQFERLVAIMLTGVFNGIRTFGASMRERGGGHIVNTASLSGLLPAANVGAYTAAKFAVIGLSEVLRAEMEPHDVGVSVLCPGAVRTNLTAAAPRPTSDRPTIARVIEPEVVGQYVVDAILANELYVLTHAEAKPAVAARSARLLEAFDRLARREHGDATVTGTAPTA